jgi:hypothetical protein
MLVGAAIGTRPSDRARAAACFDLLAIDSSQGNSKF